MEKSENYSFISKEDIEINNRIKKDINYLFKYQSLKHDNYIDEDEAYKKETELYEAIIKYFNNIHDEQIHVLFLPIFQRLYRKFDNININNCDIIFNLIHTLLGINIKEFKKMYSNKNKDWEAELVVSIERMIIKDFWNNNI